MESIPGDGGEKRPENVRNRATLAVPLRCGRLSTSARAGGAVRAAVPAICPHPTRDRSAGPRLLPNQLTRQLQFVI